MFLLNTLLLLQPRSGGGGGSREDAVNDLAKVNFIPLNEESYQYAYTANEEIFLFLTSKIFFLGHLVLNFSIRFQ